MSRLWSSLFHDRPRLELELAKAGTTIEDFALDVRDVPELREKYRLGLDRSSQEARLQLGLEWFGDQGHPQPEQRTNWVLLAYGDQSVTRTTRDFGRLHILDDLAPENPARERHRDRKEPAPIPTRLVEEAIGLHVEHGYGRRRIAERLPEITEYQAGQILGWFRAGEPGGLWLEGGRLRWSKAISTTRDGMRLPRL